MRSCLIALALIFLASCHTDENTLSELIQKIRGEFQGQHYAATQPHQVSKVTEVFTAFQDVVMKMLSSMQVQITELKSGLDFMETRHSRKYLGFNGVPKSEDEDMASINFNICGKQLETNSWYRRGNHEKHYKDVTQTQNHHRHYSRHHSSKTFHLPSGQTYSSNNPHTSSWHRRRNHEKQYDVTKSPNHHRHYSRHHSSKTFLLPSGQTYSVKNPHESESVPCLPGAKVVEIKNVEKHYKAEYNMVVNEFTKSSNEPTKKFQIEKVEKVFNGCWMQKYIYRQDQIKRDLADGESINEKMIFHGTSNAHIVAQKGLDERFAKKELDFGAGIYFSDHSSKANERSKTNKHGLREVLLCRVTLGKKFMATSVKKYAHAPVGFQSVVSGSRYVIYRGEQAYPDYIITFKEV